MSIAAERLQEDPLEHRSREQQVLRKGDPRELQQEARRALGWAREHKHEAELHKRRAKAELIRFRLFKAQLERMGIRVIIEPTATQPQRRQSDNRNPQEHT